MTFSTRSNRPAIHRSWFIWADSFFFVQLNFCFEKISSPYFPFEQNQYKSMNAIYHWLHAANLFAASDFCQIKNQFVVEIIWFSSVLTVNFGYTVIMGPAPCQNHRCIFPNFALLFMNFYRLLWFFFSASPWTKNQLLLLGIDYKMEPGEIWTRNFSQKLLSQKEHQFLDERRKPKNLCRAIVILWLP